MRTLRSELATRGQVSGRALRILRWHSMLVFRPETRERASEKQLTLWRLRCLFRGNSARASTRFSQRPALTSFWLTGNLYRLWMNGRATLFFRTAGCRAALAAVGPLAEISVTTNRWSGGNDTQVTLAPSYVHSEEN